MKKIKTIVVLTVLGTAATTAQTKWNVDASHSKLGFSVTHMMVSETEGKFKIYEGKVSSATETDFTNATIEFSVDVNSINTDDEKRDGHLKSDDFFNAEKFPKMTFKSTSMKAGKVKGTYVLEGNLTIRDVTKKVSLTVTTSGKSVKDPYGMTRMGFKVNGSISRKDFGLKWNAILEAGGVAVSEMVKIDCNIEVTKAQ
ncbi:MAG: YceI family protein [Bacteroidia bacterium]|nr:YceI family protein [Bacteroidia bacterium]